MIKVQVDADDAVAMQWVLGILDPGESALVTYRGYPNNVYDVEYDQTEREKEESNS